MGNAHANLSSAIWAKQIAEGLWGKQRIRQCIGGLWAKAAEALFTREVKAAEEKFFSGAWRTAKDRKAARRAYENSLGLQLFYIKQFGDPKTITKFAGSLVRKLYNEKTRQKAVDLMVSMALKDNEAAAELEIVRENDAALHRLPLFAGENPGRNRGRPVINPLDFYVLNAAYETLATAQAGGRLERKAKEFVEKSAAAVLDFADWVRPQDSPKAVSLANHVASKLDLDDYEKSLVKRVYKMLAAPPSPAKREMKGASSPCVPH